MVNSCHTAIVDIVGSVELHHVFSLNRAAEGIEIFECVVHCIRIELYVDSDKHRTEQRDLTCIATFSELTCEVRVERRNTAEELGSILRFVNRNGSELPLEACFRDINFSGELGIVINAYIAESIVHLDSLGEVGSAIHHGHYIEGILHPLSGVEGSHFELRLISEISIKTAEAECSVTALCESYKASIHIESAGSLGDSLLDGIIEDVGIDHNSLVDDSGVRHSHLREVLIA